MTTAILLFCDNVLRLWQWLVLTETIESVTMSLLRVWQCHYWECDNVTFKSVTIPLWECYSDTVETVQSYWSKIWTTSMTMIYKILKSFVFESFFEFQSWSGQDSIKGSRQQWGQPTNAVQDWLSRNWVVQSKTGEQNWNKIQSNTVITNTRL